MKWSEIAARQPTLGALAHEKLIRPGVLLIGTTRRDGSARISGVEPLVMAGELWLSMMSGSTKAHDLERDARLVLHSIVTGPQAAPEIKIRAVAHRETRDEIQRRYAAAVAAELGWQPVVGHFSLFRVDIADVTYIGYDADAGAQHVARWPAGVEFLRRTVTPTSLAAPEPAVLQTILCKE